MDVLGGGYFGAVVGPAKDRLRKALDRMGARHKYRKGNRSVEWKEKNSLKMIKEKRHSDRYGGETCRLLPEKNSKAATRSKKRLRIRTNIYSRMKARRYCARAAVILVHKRRVLVKRVLSSRGKRKGEKGSDAIGLAIHLSGDPWAWKRTSGKKTFGQDGILNKIAHGENHSRLKPGSTGKVPSCEKPHKTTRQEDAGKRKYTDNQ